MTTFNNPLMDKILSMKNSKKWLFPKGIKQFIVEIVFQNILFPLNY